MQICIHLGTVMLLLSANAIACGDERLEVWISRLGSDKPSEFRVAQVYLSRLGSAPLDRLDEHARTADDRLKQRMKEMVALMLFNGIELSEVQRRPHLYDLPKVEFAKAHELANQLTKAVQKAERENPDSVDNIQWHHLDGTVSKVLSELHGLHGWGVPAWLKLTENKSPFLKMMAIDSLVIPHDARLSASVLKRLKNDRTPIVRFHGDYSVRSTIADEMDSLIERRPQLVEKPSYSGWHRTLFLLHEFQGADLEKGGILEWPTISFDPKWSFNEYWAAARSDMERIWDSQTTNKERLRHGQSIQRQRRPLRRLRSLLRAQRARR